MILQKNDRFYESALSAKVNTMNAAVKLATELRDTVNNLQDENERVTCKAALIAFYNAIVLANKPNKNSRDVIIAANKLLPLDSIIPDANACYRKTFDACLNAQDTSECQNHNVKFAIQTIAEWLLLAGIAAAITATAILMPVLPVLLFLPCFFGGLIALFTTVHWACKLAQRYDTKYFDAKERDCVGGRAAIYIGNLSFDTVPGKIDTQVNAANDASPLDQAGFFATSSPSTPSAPALVEAVAVVATPC